MILGTSGSRKEWTFFKEAEPRNSLLALLIR